MKRGPGRPRTMRDGEQISFWCPRALKKALNVRARNRGVTRSSHIREICHEDVKRDIDKRA